MINVLFFIFSQRNITLLKKEKKTLAEYNEYIRDIVKTKKVNVILLYYMILYNIFYRAPVHLLSQCNILFYCQIPHRLNYMSGTSSNVQQNMTSDPGKGYFYYVLLTLAVFYKEFIF